MLTASLVTTRCHKVLTNVKILLMGENLLTAVLRFLVDLLIQVFQEAIKNFQKVLDRLFIPPNNIFSCKVSRSPNYTSVNYYCWYFYVPPQEIKNIFQEKERPTCLFY